MGSYLKAFPTLLSPLKAHVRTQVSVVVLDVAVTT